MFSAFFTIYLGTTRKVKKKKKMTVSIHRPGTKFNRKVPIIKDVQKCCSKAGKKKKS